MQFPIVREYRTDLTNSNLENEIPPEPFKVDAGVWTRVIAPRHAPFFVSSLKLYFSNGEPMTPGVHYRVFRLMGKLTELAKVPISCTVELLDPTITEGLIEYDTIGEFSLLDNSLWSLINAARNDDRPALWENTHGKPVVFPPKLHGHSLIYDIMAFADLIELLDLIAEVAGREEMSTVELKLQSYLSTMNAYIIEYRKMLLQFLDDHKATYDGHGLNKTQVGLPLVDNFPTARTKAELESDRTDMHMTVNGLRQLINTAQPEEGDFLSEGMLPISQFGESYSSLPAIAALFEPNGCKAETAALVEERDGTIVSLANRLDGRANGLYYSIIQRPTRAIPLLYTGQKYSHPRLITDAANPDVIAQGSGKDVILIADSVKEVFYIGATNGTLDSSKHALVKLTTTVITSIVGSTVKLSSLIHRMNVALLGDWIYIFMAHGPVTANEYDLRYRYFFRVPLASVQAGTDVSAARVNVTFTDGEGAQVSGAAMWRWCTPVGSGTQFTKWYHTFVNPPTELKCYGASRGQTTYVMPIPTKPGKFLVKFVSSFWVGHLPTGNAKELLLDMTYEYDPATAIMTLVHKTPNQVIDMVDTSALPVIPANLLALNRRPGALVLRNGAIHLQGSLKGSWPPVALRYSPAEPTSIQQTLGLNWGTQLGQLATEWVHRDRSVSSGTETPATWVFGEKMKSFMLGNGGDYYLAKLRSGQSGLFYNEAPGALAIRADVKNLFYPSMRSRPLSTSIRRVNVPPVIGGFTLTLPSNYLPGYGLDVGEARFCVSTQRRHLTQYAWPAGWPLGDADDDIMLVDSHTHQVTSTGTINIIPASTLLYPASVVEQLKERVADVAAMRASGKVFVTVCDPSILNAKFGWLPVLVYINYAKDATTRCVTMLSIQPTYTGTGTRTVTDFSVLNWIHNEYQTLSGVAPGVWDAAVSGVDAEILHGAMRAGYYLHYDAANGLNKFNTYFDSGVIAKGLEGWSSAYGAMGMTNRNDRVWTDAITASTYEGVGSNMIVIPDNGVDIMLDEKSAGWANTLFLDTRSSAVPATAVNQLGPVYPYKSWVVRLLTDFQVVFNGGFYNATAGTIDLRDFAADPSNKTFYLYVSLVNNRAVFELSQNKRLETPERLWIAEIITGVDSISVVNRFKVTALNGHRVTETKRGNSLPATSLLVGVEGKLPWIRTNELLP